MPAGRPSDYSIDVATFICGQLADGQSLRAICRADDMPDKATVFRWLFENTDFRDQYARAKEDSADAHADDVIDIADDGTNDWMERHNSEGECIGWQLNGEHVQRSKLRVDARKWIASKLKAKKYGDKTDLNITGNLHIGTLKDFGE